MITTLKTENSTDYKRLFASALAYLKDPENAQFIPLDRQETIAALTSITSVQEYFSYIKDILDIGANKGAVEEARKYLMLPLDEPYFEVDANKREIIVPAEFKKNGISVQGDNIAESLIFKINRFFDYADLNNMKVRVQWENANKETGVSEVFVVDASKDVDYLFIMWPLTTEITKYAGTIKFSLRFYEISGASLSYSFSTKIAAATINSGHNFNEEQIAGSNNIDSAANAFSSAIKNSINTAQEKPKPPFFLIDLDDVSEDRPNENADYNSGEVIEAYIDAVDNKTQTLRVEATSTDAGLISYEWMYIDTLDTRTFGGSYKLDGEVAYIPIPDTEIEAVPHKMYYTKTTQNGNPVYTETDFTLQEGLQLYEKTHILKVHMHENNDPAEGIDLDHINDGRVALPHVVGKYYAIAKNTVGSNSVTTDSLTIVFPAPEHLAFTETGDLADNNYLNSTGEGSISVEVEVDERGAKPTFVWAFSDDITGPFVEISSLPVEERNKLATNALGNVLTINNKPGFYQVKAISTRNYATIETLSNKTKVTLPLGAPVITAPLTDVAVSSLYGTATLTVEVEPMNDPLLSEDITYQWFNDQDEMITGATSNTLVVDRGTRMGYYCIVTNHMGQDTKSTKSPDFSVNPINPVSNSQVVDPSGGSSEQGQG